MTDAPMRFLIAVPGLRVTTTWQIGRVRIHPATSHHELLVDVPMLGGIDGPLSGWVRRALGDGSDDAVADLPLSADQASTTAYAEEALDEIRSALDVLRLFQESRSITDHTTFGLPGDLYQAATEFVLVGKQVTPGSMYLGDYTGWTFDDASHDEWAASETFQFLSAALADPRPSEGARRAVLGAKLYSRAATEHRVDLKVVGLLTALEAWLLPRHDGAPSARMARHIAWFNCNRDEGEQCGRQRAMCPYLHIEPDKSSQLKLLEKLGRDNDEWACSDWLRIRGLYDQRSATALAGFGGPPDASSAQHVIAHDLCEPILEWLRTHPVDPIGALEAVIDAVPEPAGWARTVRAIVHGHPTPPAASDLSRGTR